MPAVPPLSGFVHYRATGPHKTVRWFFFPTPPEKMGSAALGFEGLSAPSVTGKKRYASVCFFYTRWPSPTAGDRGVLVENAVFFFFPKCSPPLRGTKGFRFSCWVNQAPTMGFRAAEGLPSRGIGLTEPLMLLLGTKNKSYSSPRL